MLKTRKNTRFLLMLLILMSLFLVACGDDDEEDGDNGDDNQPAGVELAETFDVSADGVNVVFNYPSGWATLAEPGAGVVIASSEAVLEAASPALTDTSIDPTTLAVEGTAIITSLNVASPDEGLGATAAESIAPIITFLTEGGATVGESSEFTVEGFDSGVKFAFSREDGGNGAIYAVQNTEFALFIVATSNDFAANEATVDAVVQSMRISFAEDGGTDPVEAGTTEPVEAGTTEPVEASTTEPVEAGTTEPVEASTTEPVEAGTAEPVEMATEAATEEAAQ